MKHCVGGPFSASEYVEAITCSQIPYDILSGITEPVMAVVLRKLLGHWVGHGVTLFGMKTSEVQRSGLAVLRLLSDYKGTKVKKNERAVDPVFLSYLRGAGYSVSRQHHVWMYGSTKPQRIDFRVAGNPRGVIELAVRPLGGGPELSAKINRKELLKLSRVTQKAAHMRFLLLLDGSNRLGPVPQVTLQEDYAAVNAGPGRFRRNPVRVVYVHLDDQYNFPWSP